MSNLKSYPISSFKVDNDYLDVIRVVLNEYNIGTNRQPPWLAGGTVRRLIEEQPYMGADFDLFFQNTTQKRNFEKLIKHNPLRSNSLTTTWGYTLGAWNITIQAIYKKSHTTLDALLNDFDISCCQLATDGYNIYTYEHVLECIKTKKLVLNYKSIDSTLSTFQRIIKMTQDGYTFSLQDNKKFLDFVITNPQKCRYPLYDIPKVENESVFF